MIEESLFFIIYYFVLLKYIKSSLYITRLNGFASDVRYGLLKNECLIVNNNSGITFSNVKFSFKL